MIQPKGSRPALPEKDNWPRETNTLTIQGYREHAGDLCFACLPRPKTCFSHACAVHSQQVRTTSNHLQLSATQPTFHGPILSTAGLLISHF